MMVDRWQELGDQLKKPNTLVVNLYGGPGTGKSTTAALAFALLKEKGFTAELVTEFAKDLVWEQRHHTLSDQIYVFGKQQHRVSRLMGQVDVVITDSPIMLTPVYSVGTVAASALNDLAFELHSAWRTLNFFLRRNNKSHPYNERGRYQTLNQAEEVDRDILKALNAWCVDFEALDMGDTAAASVVLAVEKTLA